MFTEKDINVRMKAMRKHAEERLHDAKRHWQATLVRVRARYRHRMAEVRARIRALQVHIQIPRLDPVGYVCMLCMCVHAGICDMIKYVCARAPEVQIRRLDAVGYVCMCLYLSVCVYV